MHTLFENVANFLVLNGLSPLNIGGILLIVFAIVGFLWANATENQVNGKSSLYQLIDPNGLNWGERKLLNRILSDANVQEKSVVIKDVKQLDRYLKNGYRYFNDVGGSDNTLATIFAIRNRLEPTRKFMQDSIILESQVVKRQFKRHSLHTACKIYIMGQAESPPHRGEKIASPDILKSVVANSSTPVFSGHIIDISAGGSLLKVSADIEEGALIRIEFNVLINVLSSIDGQVKGVEKKDNASRVRVEFKNLSQKSLNAINAIVFGYDRG
jgi:hypothetical protein